MSAAGGGGGPPLPLPSNAAEVFLLAVDGQALARGLFYGCWVLQLAVLLMSRWGAME